MFKHVPTVARVAALVAGSILAASCASIPSPRALACADAAPPAIAVSSDGRTEHAQLDVLIYNMEGLGWPARKGRAAELSEIGHRLAALRQTGQAPDVVLFQEVFSGAARHAVEDAGYPALVAGPSRHARRQLPADGRVPGRRWKEGELGLKLASSGLAIVSRYPIVEHEAEPFSHRSCAGTDCFSNKGALLARIAIPGVPDPIDVFDAHMNARTRSGAAPARTLVAHHVEARELADFVNRTAVGDAPILLGGDFNMRHSQPRFDAFEKVEPMAVVQRYCLQPGAGCQTRINWQSQTPWLDTEDLQLFQAGHRVDIRPIRVETMFDGRPDSPKLSDHNAFRVVYELSWRTDATPARETCQIEGDPRHAPAVIAAAQS